MPALTGLLARVKSSTALGVVIFTGFEWDEIQSMPGQEQFLACVDALITGRYRAEVRLARGLRGSANKNIHLLTQRYSAGEFETIPEAELIIFPDGSLQASGIAPLTWQNQ
jgi:anaerobic ribonucleoside-triphosphate reductase activating protein